MTAEVEEWRSRGAKDKEENIVVLISNFTLNT
jgi:hypothetical protein